MQICVLRLILAVVVMANVMTMGKEMFGFNLNKQLLTVGFNPATSFLDPDHRANLAEVQDMLEVVSSRFQHVFTYHSGTLTDKPWNSSENDAASLTPVAAANLNKKKKQLVLQVTVGIFLLQNSNLRLDKWELRNALESSSEANKIFPGTVISMFIRFKSNITSEIVLYWLSQLSQGLQPSIENVTLGIYTESCDEFNSFAILRELKGPIYWKFFSQLDYFACVTDLYKKEMKGIEDFEKSFGKFLANEYLFNQTDDMESTPSIDIIPVGFQESSSSESNKFGNSVKEMVNYWQNWNDWASKTKHRVWLLGAFDSGPVSEDDTWSRYGWWERLSDHSSHSDAFLEKETVLKETTAYYYYYPYCATGVIILLSIICIIFRIRRYFTKKLDVVIPKEASKYKNRPKTKNRTLSNNALFSNNADYEIHRKDVKIDEVRIMGKGAFGEVFKGQLKEGPMVAVKTIAADKASPSSMKCFLSEIKVMIHVGKHQNVVSFLGADTSKIQNGSILIFLELCDLGSLETYLRKNFIILLSQSSTSSIDSFQEPMRDPNTWPEGNHVKLLKWSNQICCGMEHISSKKVIHADLATRNVLLTNEEIAKVTDFGLSKRLYEYASYAKSNSELLPWRWMSVESLQSLKFTTASDVWAFGVTLWEIFSDGRVPYAGINWTTSFLEKLENGLKLPKPPKASEEIYLRMTECWDLDPDSRPHFEDLKDFFADLLPLKTAEICLPIPRLQLIETEV